MKINSSLRLNIDDTFGNFDINEKNKEEDIEKLKSMDSAK